MYRKCHPYFHKSLSLHICISLSFLLVYGVYCEDRDATTIYYLTNVFKLFILFYVGLALITVANSILICVTEAFVPTEIFK